MTKNILDARGLSCPEPVLKAKAACAEFKEFDILVDTEVAKENVSRFVQHAGFQVKVRENAEGDFVISVNK